jgi:Fe-S-cluster containining protein
MPAEDPNQIAREKSLSKVRSVYSDLAALPIERNCQLRTECCQFHLTGKTPFLTRGEALLAAKALRATGRTALPESKEETCPMLDPRTSRCRIYANRPFGCRTHFCSAAGGALARKDVLDFIHRLVEIDEDLGGDGPRPITDALEYALIDL